MNFLFLFLLRRKMNYLSCGWMVLPTNSAALFDRLPLSIARTTSWSGGVPAISLSLNSPARSIAGRICAGVRDPAAYRPATYQLCQPFHSSDLLWCYSLINLTLTMRPSHLQVLTSFSVSRELFTLHMLQWCHDRLWVKLISTRKPLCCEADSEVGSAIIGRTKRLWLCPWSKKKKVIIIWNLKVGAKSKR